MLRSLPEPLALDVLKNTPKQLFEVLLIFFLNYFVQLVGLGFEFFFNVKFG